MRSPKAPRRAAPLVRPRTSLAALGTLTALALAVQPTIATADTARLGSPTSNGRAIVLTAADGTTRTIGPYDVDPWPMTLRISPDRRQIAIIPVAPSLIDTVLIVPTDGGPARTLTIGPQRRGLTGRSDLSWTTDGQALIIGDTKLGRASRDERHWSRVLRCDLVASACHAIPGVDGVAAPVPGGIVTSSSVGSLVPFDPGFVDVGPSRPSQRLLRFRVDRDDRGKLRSFAKRQRSRTALVTDTTRTLTAETASLEAGIDGAITVVGGPSGALLVHQRHRTRVTRGKRGSTVDWRVGPLRWTLIDPSGARRTMVAPRLRIPTRLVESTPESAGRTTRLATVVPRTALPVGGWLADVQTLTEAGHDGHALATITPDGRASLVRSNGKLVAATDLIRTPLGRRASSHSASFRLIGHEATSNAAVVVVNWGEERRSDYRYMRATVRVPLDGRTPPSVVSRSAENEAW